MTGLKIYNKVRKCAKLDNHLLLICLGCQLSWVNDAERFVSFVNDEELFEHVHTTLWVKPNALKCSLNLDDIAKLSFSVETREALEESQTESRNETKKDDDFYNFQNGKKVLKSKQELGNIAHKATTFELKRWRSYKIEVRVKWREQETTKSFSHDTFQWMCVDKNKSISQTKFCDGKKECPDGDDENPEICEASDLLKKLSYIISYPLILILVVSYFVLPKIHYNQSVVKKISIEFGIKKTNVKALQETAARKDEFITKYKKAHSNLSEMKMLVDEMKYDLYKKGNKGNQQEVSSWVKEIEDELHNNPEERYQCILTHYKASHPLIDKIADPEGGILGKIGKLGLNLNCLLLFVLLLFHIFDYVKDIGNKPMIKCKIPNFFS